MHISRILNTALLALFCATAVAAQGRPAPAPAAQQNSVALRQGVAQSGGRVIITMKPTPDEAASILRNNRGRGRPVLPAQAQARVEARLVKDKKVKKIIRPMRETSMLVAQIDETQLSGLLSDPNIMMVEPDELHRLTAVDHGDVTYGSLAQELTYGVAQVKAPELWAATGNRGEGVKVAIMDSGISPNHPDLVVVGGYVPMTQSDTGWADTIAPCNGHGTHVAGTVAARDNDIGVVGVAPNVQLYAIRVFENMSGKCLAWSSNQIQGLNWAVTQGIRVVNASIGGSWTGSYSLAVANAASKGTFLVGSAGNAGGIPVMSPAAYDSSFAIGGVGDTHARASWSSYGPQLDFMAPGVNIKSTLPGGGYGGKSGTSMASPHAAGVVALILSAYPNLTHQQIYQKLRDGALDLETPGFDEKTGWGSIRAFNSLVVEDPEPPCSISLGSAGSRVYNAPRVDSVLVMGNCPFTATSSRSNTFIRGQWILFTSTAADTIRVRKQ